MTTRRKFITTAAIAPAAALATPALAQSTIKWRMQTYAGGTLGEYVIKPAIDAFNKIAGDQMQIELFYADQLVPTGELFQAMQRGTIDAVRSSIIVMGGSKFFTVTKFITVVESGMIPSVVMLSDVWLKKLSGKQRSFVIKTLADMSDWNNETAAAYGKNAEKLWKDNGAEVIRLSAADQKSFMDIVRPLGDEFLGKLKNEGVQKIYGLLKASAKRNMKMMK